LLDEPPAARSGAAVAWQFLLLGFEHILPEGVDHILFVLGLYLLSPRLRPLLWQVTAFTVAHTATLALSMYGVVSLPARVVEPLIALSIVYVAVENLVTQELKWWRPMAVFGFGLLHGLGFAGVLTELAPPRSEFVAALVSFNVGVELGQLAVIGLALLLTGWWRGREWYRGRIVKPASLAIAAVALFWTVERVIS
ncbi:MAG TPA: HupE/UreJ family protein, partial [Phycisphaerae bacterium]|nr:HupE/UreJ family protein [Phycisphaerae bacterium]